MRGQEFYNGLHMRKSLLRALLHNASKVRKIGDRDLKALKKVEHLDLEKCLYEETNYIQNLQETVFGYSDEKFYSIEGIQEIDSYEKQLKQPLSNEDIKNISNQNDLTSSKLEDNFTPEEIKEIELEERLLIQEEMREEIEDLIDGFLELTPEYRKIFHESVQYVLQADEQEYDFESYEQIEKEKDIRVNQADQSKKLEEMSNQMLELTKMLLEQKNTSMSVKAEEQQVVEQKTHLSVAEFTAKWKKSRETQRQWRKRHHDPLPFRRFNGNGRIYYIVEEVEQWLENNS